MSSNRIKLLEQVVGAIVNLKDARGSPLEKIINYMESSKSKTVKRTPAEIRKTLIYGINHGIFKEQDGRYKIGLDCRNQKQSRRQASTLATRVMEMKGVRGKKRKQSRPRRGRRRHDDSVDLKSLDSEEHLRAHRRKGGKNRRRRRSRRRRTVRRHTEISNFKSDDDSGTISPNSTPIPEDRSRRRKNRKRKSKRKGRGKRRHADNNEQSIGDGKDISPKISENAAEIQKKIDHVVEEGNNDSEDDFGKRISGIRSKVPRESHSPDSASDIESRANTLRKSSHRLNANSNCCASDAMRPSKERSKPNSKRNTRSAIHIQEAYQDNFEDDDSPMIPDYDNDSHNKCQYDHCDDNDAGQN